MNLWSKEPTSSGKYLMLLTPDEFEALPEGTVLHSIYYEYPDYDTLSNKGERKVKGKDEIDMDTRGGHIAFGLLFEKEEV